jgi:catechol 2,3-dioxygenase-like lactoylglutathione lyase family enzyme
MILDHITVSVSDVKRSKAFYERVYDPDGYNIEAVCHAPG